MGYLGERMLQPVTVGSKTLSDYAHLVGRPLVDEITELAEQLNGLKVLHLSATAFGGGVSEILYTLVPLMRDVGIDAQWQIIVGQEEFFNVTKLMHNSIQGADESPSDEQWDIFERYNLINARELDAGWDVVIVHDPQPAGVRMMAPDKATSWIWRCHIDVSTPNPDMIARLMPMIQGYDAHLFHSPTYVPEGLEGNINLVPPAIDPLAPKNMALSPVDARYVCAQFDIDVDRPLMCQVSRFDPWKDPAGVIDAYRIVKQQVPDVQLALVGSMATDDPEGWDFFNMTVEHAGDDPDIKILNNFNNVGNIEVNAFQVQSDVLIQKSTREGFGLTVSEGLWKGRPFIGGNVGGIPLQITDEKNGYLVDSAEQCAKRSLDILQNPELAVQLGLAGKEHVREHFLTPRLLRDWLKLFNQLA
ncbi:MAG: glycosyltransferase [Thermoleophilaceae bacterium]|nr:glycosyltransferase [Thermoleophilaceae bacterium]